VGPDREECDMSHEHESGTDHQARKGHDPGTEHDDRDRPTTDQPLHGRKRPLAGPVLITLGVIALLVVLYLLGVTYLVPAD
jgi:hypothetical protein